MVNQSAPLFQPLSSQRFRVFFSQAGHVHARRPSPWRGREILFDPDGPVERETRGNRKKASRKFMEIFTRCPRTRKRHRGVSHLVFLADVTPPRPVSL